jgi:aminopeptidase-like protein
MTLSMGDEMYAWAEELFPINRSLTGDGVRKTLAFIKSHFNNLEIHEVPSGTPAFDWNIPNEWSVNDGFISDLDGNKLIDFTLNNLHVMGYSSPVNKIVSRAELELHLHSIPSQPDAIPYVTSYYKENYGFCLSQIQRDALGAGPFQIFIDSKLFTGSLTYGELFIPGQSEEEVLFSTYVCHPQLANNELSGPVVSMGLADYIYSLSSRRYSYRFLFTVETIGSIYYISKHLEEMKKNIIAGWVLTCIGDNRNFSYVPTRNGNSFTDKISRRVLKDLDQKYIEYSWLDRGSDERQYCSPGVDLPIGSLMRTKYGEYPEYHTSLDNLDVISSEGLQGGLEMLQSAVRILESNNRWEIKTRCEPQLGKRGLYPNISTKSSWGEIENQMNVISYLDGDHDLMQIADNCRISFDEVMKIVEKLKQAELVDLAKIR